MASVTTQWEAAAAAIESTKTRVVYARTGLVIAKTGAMAPLRLQTFLGVAGPIGSGRQWWPWISYRDEIRALVFLLEQQQLTGPFNLVGTHSRDREGGDPGSGSAHEATALAGSTDLGGEADG